MYIIFILLDVIKTAINNNRTTPRGIESIILLSGQIISLLGFIASLSVDTPDNLSETPDNLDEIPDETPDKPPADNLDDTSSIIVSKIAADIKNLKPVEPYKAKGIKERGQFILRKEGKKK